MLLEKFCISKAPDCLALNDYILALNCKYKVYLICEFLTNYADMPFLSINDFEE
jgi:hypothetical protein